MRFLELPTGKKMSVLGFGCAPLMGRAGRSDSMRALAAAEDAGINFFDTARAYGFGEAEGLLGQFLQGRRHDAVVCTKFGILPAAKGGWKQRVKPLAQQAIRLFPSLRGFARRQGANQLHAGHFTLDDLQTSLDTSLRELRTDHVDMLLLHAAPIEILDRDDLFAALERLVESGKVRMAGISGEAGVIAESIRRGPAVLKTAQLALNVKNLETWKDLGDTDRGKMMLVGNHPFDGPAGVAATSSRIEALRTSERLPAPLRDKLTANDPSLMPEIVLNLMLASPGNSAVVAAMVRPQNVRRNAEAIARCRFTSDELGLLREELIRQPQR